ncbi:MAG TPA: hypothetical protein DCX70_03885, partial [Chitinophagaceae bacterium]|nr:hypothetical protein [Chitinophagaceae bacterium]
DVYKRQGVFPLTGIGIYYINYPVTVFATFVGQGIGWVGSTVGCSSAFSAAWFIEGITSTLIFTNFDRS